MITEMLYSTKSGTWFMNSDRLANHLVSVDGTNWKMAQSNIGNEAEIEKYTYRSTGQMLF